MEIDTDLAPVLAENLAQNLPETDNVELIFADFMEMELDFLKEYQHLVCVSNLPYYITTPVILRLLESGLPLYSVVVMTQREAAVRLAAVPGGREGGAVSAAVWVYSAARSLFHVPRGNFYPVPDVDSAVI